MTLSPDERRFCKRCDDTLIADYCDEQSLSLLPVQKGFVTIDGDRFFATDKMLLLTMQDMNGRFSIANYKSSIRNGVITSSEIKFLIKVYKIRLDLFKEEASDLVETHDCCSHELNPHEVSWSTGVLGDPVYTWTFQCKSCRKKKSGTGFSTSDIPVEFKDMPIKNESVCF